jgi:di/tricarboxylate transporter
MVLGTSFVKTGIVGKIAQKIMQVVGTSESRVVSLLSLTVAIPSAIMPNVGAVAFMLPAHLKISRLSKIPASEIIMPLGFCANMGGNLTLVGSTPLIILNDVMAKWWTGNGAQGGDFVPLSLFYVTPYRYCYGVGGACLFSADRLPIASNPGRKRGRRLRHL